MANILARFLKGGSSTDISTAIEQAKADLSTAESAVVSAENAYDDALLTETPVALRKLSDAKQDAAIEVDRCRAVIAKLEGQLERATASEAEISRLASYEKAKDLSEAARKRLIKDYPKAAENIRSILRELAEAELAVRAANDNLPEGAPVLQGPEVTRGAPTLYREELGEEVVELWCGVGDRSTPIPDNLQSRVHPEARIRRGETELRGSLPTSSSSMEVVKRRLIRRKFRSQQSGRYVAPLASDVALPPLLAGASDFWKPESGGAHGVLQQLNKPLLEPAASAERPIEIEYVPAPKERSDVA